MPYIKIPKFKTGINPNHRSMFDLANLTPTQKLELTSSRIFGHNIGSNHPSGIKVLRRVLVGPARFMRYKYPIWDIRMNLPFYQNKQEIAWKKYLDERRKLRIMMRGVKVGRQKGGGRVSLMNIFETKQE